MAFVVNINVYIRTNGVRTSPYGGTFSYSIPKHSSGGTTFSGMSGSGETEFSWVLTNSNISMSITRTTPNAGYLFKKWSIYSSNSSSATTYDSTYKTITVSSGSVSGVTKTVYIDYAGKTYTITLDRQGGSGGSASASATYQKAIPSSISVPTRSNHKFLGYFTEKNGGGTQYYSEDGSAVSGLVYSTASAMTLYAAWEFTGFSVTVSKDAVEGAAYSVYDIGNLSLYNETDGKSESVDIDEETGSLSFTGEAEKKYLLTVGGVPNLYSALGVKVGTSYVSSYSFTPSQGDEIELSYIIEKKASYGVTLKAVSESGDEVAWASASISSPESPDETVEGVARYASGTDVRVSVSVNAGYKVSGYRLTYVNSSGQEISAGYTAGDVREFIIPSISRTYTAYVVLERKSYSISCDIDEASESAIEQFSSSISSGYNGDSAVLSAKTYDGYAIDAFYVGDTRIVPTLDNGVWKATITIGYEDVSVVAKGSVKVSLAIEYLNNLPVSSPSESCSISVNGSRYGGQFNVALGGSFEYELAIGKQSDGSDAHWIFGAWYSSEDISRVNPTQHGVSGTITPTAGMSLVAVVMSKAIENVLTIVAKKNADASVITPTSGISFTTDVTPVSTSTTETGYNFVFGGTRNVKVSCPEKIGNDVFKVVSGGGTIAERDEKSISSSREFTIMVNSNATLYVYYGEAGIVKVSFSYGNPSDGSMGEIAVDGLESTTGGEISVEQGKTVGVSVTSKNGYRFVGWYDAPECLGESSMTDKSESVQVFDARTYYAYFKKDGNAVFEWEGSSVNKMMEWRSKTYVGARPYNPTTVRVDANGYPMKYVSAEMFSSPDSSPTSICSLSNVESQFSRRLPRGRLERYMQIVLKNDAEVDSVIVSTNTIGA